MTELRNIERELFRFRRRLILAAAVVVLSFALLIGRWVWLQVVRHRQFSTQALDNRIALVPIAPQRGLILDRNGIILANNYAAYTLEITPSKVKGRLQDTIDALKAIVPITPFDERRFDNLLSQSRRFESLPILNKLSDDEVARFVVQRFRFPGVNVRARLFRNYPLGALGCHLLGYIGRINQAEQQRIDDSDDASNYLGTDHIGKLGVEQAYEAQLHGVTGYEEVEVNATGRPVRKIKTVAAIPGQNLVLGVDIRLQKLIEDLYGKRRGACVAIDPRNGEVLAFVSMPTYDPNLFVDGIDQVNWDALNTSPDRPLLNRALRGTFPPGSTYKPYLATGALTEGIRTAQWSFHDPGFFMFAGHRFRDDVPGGHGIVDMHKAIQVSCDVYFYMVAHDWGVDGMARWTQQFGFGQVTGIDLKGEAKGVLPSREWKRRAFRSPEQQRWYPGDTISLGIGQGYNSFTPLQMGVALSTLANRGTRYEPRVVRAIEDMATRRFTPVAAPVAQRIELNPAYWQVVHDGMIAVNQTGGTAAEAFKGAPYTAAGKTGTAQVISVAQNQTYDAKDIAHHLRDHALYVVYAPAENPVIALALIVENAGFGGVAAAPIARKALDYYLLGLYPTDEEIEKISGVRPQPVQFAYAGEREGVPPIPGAKPPPGPAASGPASAAAAGSAAGIAAKPASAPTAASPARAQPTALDADAVGNYPRTACTGGLRMPLFTRFGARPEVSDEAQGVRL
ncbi:MAG: penicillin-binding protein 2 [Thiomonas sp.]|uniref:penicillin-binding protein 2 n=1 Tax=Thiomonas sp. TaxID=2047785 RepID=UPI002A35C272|nr:penicillin-binding protein 2 [Thiomonas sp.]MDY0329213.1 penicillin-binding protein 2 [Thiomonas sp.]